jgi:hypothetical protein
MIQLGKVKIGSKEPSIEHNLESTIGNSKIKLPKLAS